MNVPHPHSQDIPVMHGASSQLSAPSVSATVATVALNAMVWVYIAALYNQSLHAR